MGLLDETLNRIQPLDQDAMEQAGQRWSDLYLGMGNLGKMEDMVVRYAGITGEAIPDKPKCCMVIACADHGVYKQGVSAYPAVDDGRHDEVLCRCQGRIGQCDGLLCRC